MQTIPLTRGKVAIVDDSDYRRLVKHRWFCKVVKKRRCYAYRNATGGRHVRKAISMHSQILGEKLGFFADHISRDSLDNRRANLRFATGQQNAANRGPNKNNKFGLKGVCRQNGRPKFVAQIHLFRKKHYLGEFNTPKEAALAYNNAASLAFGEFAYLNPV